MHAYKGTDEFVRKKEWQVIWVHIWTIFEINKPFGCGGLWTLARGWILFHLEA